jgi:hypothetical protein
MQSGTGARSTSCVIKRWRQGSHLGNTRPDLVGRPVPERGGRAPPVVQGSCVSAGGGGEIFSSRPFTWGQFFDHALSARGKHGWSLTSWCRGASFIALRLRLLHTATNRSTELSTVLGPKTVIPRKRRGQKRNGVRKDRLRLALGKIVSVPPLTPPPRCRARGVPFCAEGGNARVSARASSAWLCETWFPDPSDTPRLRFRGESAETKKK